MSNDLIRHNRPVSSRLHPIVYAAMACLALWLVVSAWAFASDSYVAWLLAVVSGFILIVVSLLFILSRVGSHDPGAHQSDAMRQYKNFHDWRSGDFEMWRDRVKGTRAAIEILLPLAAVAFGMSAFAIVYLSVHSAA